MVASTSTRSSSVDTESDISTPTIRCVASMSPSSRETSAPVCVRVKKASDCRCNCRNTLARSSSTRLSPIHSEYRDLTYPAAAPVSASPATASASVMTTFSRRRRMPSSMISRKSNGLATRMAEFTAVTPTSSTIGPRYCLRYDQIRRTVPGCTCCRATSSSGYQNLNPGLEIMGPLSPA